MLPMLGVVAPVGGTPEENAANLGIAIASANLGIAKRESR